MFTKAKTVTIGLALSLSAGMLLSFAQSDDNGRKKKYQVIHSQNGEVLEYDTIIPADSPYTVEDFLADKGIESENIEIIEIPFIDEQMLKEMEAQSEEMNKIIIKKEIHVEEHESEEDVQIIVKDVNGERVITKIVNGEEVEVTEEDLKNIEQHHKGAKQHKKIEVIESEEGDVEMIHHDQDVRIEMNVDDAGNMQVKKYVNGEEVEVTEEELERMKMHHNKAVFIHIDDENMSEEEKEKMMEELHEQLIELDIDIDSLHENMEIEIEMLNEELRELDGEQKIIIKELHGEENIEWNSEHHSQVRVMKDGDEDFTVVIVSEFEGEEPEMTTKIRVEEHDEEMMDQMIVFPNPNDGNFTVQFSNEEKVKTSIQIADASGRIVFEDKLGKFKGDYRELVDLKNSGTGTYSVTLIRGDQVTKQMIVVQ